MSVQPHVILRACPTYDAERIRAIVRDGMATLGLRPTGRTLVKPNLVIADREVFPHAFTRPEVTDGVLGALRDRDEGAMTELAVGERCGITVPTRMVFAESGTNAVLAKHSARRYLFDECRQVEIPLRHPHRLRDYVYTPEPIARADFFVNCPKFKAHPWTTVTFSMKNYIGIQDDRHRLIDHDHRLNDKIGDLQEIIQPQLIVIDAITAGQDRMLTPAPFDMGLIILGNNQPAFDAVCCAIIGLDPRTVDHLRIGHERGYGPLDLAEITVSGDVSLAEAQRKAKGFRTGLIRVEKYFQGSKIRAYAGPPPAIPQTEGGTDKKRPDYCWGGCPGAMEEAIEIIRQYDATTDAAMKPMTVVFGAYQGPIEAQPDEKVVFIGDCAEWKGTIAGRPVEVKSVYTSRGLLEPRTSRVGSIYQKMVKVFWSLFKTRKDPIVRATGCPVSVAEQALYIARVGKTRNPYFNPRNMLRFNLNFATYRLVTMLRRLTGQRYQILALPEHERGRAPHGPPTAAAATLPERASA